MGLFKKAKMTNEVLDLIKVNGELQLILQTNCYISKSMYEPYLIKNSKIIDFFKTLENADTLTDYINKNNLKKINIPVLLKNVLEFPNLVLEHNNNYIEQTLKIDKDYFDNILKQVDENIYLDDEQRKIIVNDEDNSLVIAGAGAGKTTTIAAKVKYLVDKKNVKPSDILVISFTNKAVKELEHRINKDLNIPCPVKTFHSIGNSIIQNTENPKTIFNSEQFYFVINDYFKKDILIDQDTMKKLLLFFRDYFNVKTNFVSYETLRDNPQRVKEIIDKKTKKKVTINNETVKSIEEAMIANFLYINGIEYEYEPIYPYLIKGSLKPYTPDFIIKQNDKVAYIEHFGITEEHTHSKYSKEELKKYINAINTKIALHKTYNTDLITTYSKYNDKKSILNHLEEELIKHNFKLHERDPKEIILELTKDENNLYIKKMVTLLCTFIKNFKTNGYSYADFDKFKSKSKNVRTKLFLDIAKKAFIYYEEYLEKHHQLDFEDMINLSKTELENNQHNFEYKYIIIDEFQDISKQRFDLTKELAKICNAKMIAVGDDWQAIFAFSGANINLFTKFSKNVGYADELKIINTYRNSQELIDIAGDFIQKNDKQIKKSLKSSKHIKDPIIIYSYPENKDKKTNEVAIALNKALEHIKNENERTQKKEYDVLLVGRFGFDAYLLGTTDDFTYNKKDNTLISHLYPEFKITFMTAHSSKGLGFSNVVILNAKRDTYGFPAQIEDDPVLKLVVETDNANIAQAEERRLFYVALTRTKNRVYALVPSYAPSEFILELIKYPQVKIEGDLNTEITHTSHNICPICGYPLQLKYKNSLGLKLYICTNDDELCGFMTNNLKGGKMSIQKCNKCRDGYLIVRANKKEDIYFLGCTNYSLDKTGCKNTMSKISYYQKYKLGKVEKEESSEE